MPDGTLAVARQDSMYFLWLEWDNAYGQRLLAQGELADIERTMTEVAVHGPTGGPEFRGQGTDWHRRRDHDTEHLLTLGGELRLMRLFGGPHLLMFARNDGGVCILGIGDSEELKRTAGARLKGFHDGGQSRNARRGSICGSSVELGPDLTWPAALRGG